MPDFGGFLTGQLALNSQFDVLQFSQIEFPVPLDLN